MRAGPNVGYKSDNGQVGIATLDDMLEYLDFQYSSTMKMYSGDMSEEAEVSEVSITMSPSDRARFVKDLAVEGITTEVTDFKEKVDMGDGTKMSWRGVVIPFDEYQVKIYNKR